MLLILPRFLAIGLFILILEISAIVHRQLVAKLRGLMRFFYCNKRRLNGLKYVTQSSNSSRTLKQTVDTNGQLAALIAVRGTSAAS